MIVSQTKAKEEKKSVSDLPKQEESKDVEKSEELFSVNQSDDNNLATSNDLISQTLEQEFEKASKISTVQISQKVTEREQNILSSTLQRSNQGSIRSNAKQIVNSSESQRMHQRQISQNYYSDITQQSQIKASNDKAKVAKTTVMSSKRPSIQGMINPVKNLQLQLKVIKKHDERRTPIFQAKRKDEFKEAIDDIAQERHSSISANPYQMSDAEVTKIKSRNLSLISQFVNSNSPTKMNLLQGGRSFSVSDQN